MSATLLEVALALRALGIGTLPAKDKRPALDEWAELQERLATDEELAAHHKDGADLAIVNGTVSGNLETCDIERGDVGERVLAMIEAEGGADMLAKIVVATSPKGLHLYYRVPQVRPGTVWARDAQGAKLIETRGEGQIAVVPPAPGRAIIGGTWKNVRQPLSRVEVSLLEHIARAQGVTPAQQRVAALEEQQAITRAILWDKSLGPWTRFFLVALLQLLSTDAMTDTTADAISEDLGVGLRQVKEGLRSAAALGVIREQRQYVTFLNHETGEKVPRRHYLRRLDRERINVLWFPRGTYVTPEPRPPRPSKENYALFRAHVTCESVLDRFGVPRWHGKFLAFWRGEKHASVDLDPPDETCAYSHWIDYGDPAGPRHGDAFDLYALCKGLYRFENGTLAIKKKAAWKAVRLDYPEIPVSSPGEPENIDLRGAEGTTRDDAVAPQPGNAHPGEDEG